jgi:hypothetical protein
MALGLLGTGVLVDFSQRADSGAHAGQSKVRDLEATVERQRLAIERLQRQLADGQRERTTGTVPSNSPEESAAPSTAPHVVDIDRPGASIVAAWQRLKDRDGAASDKVGVHDYEVLLERYLAPLAALAATGRRVHVLEIGLGCAMRYGGGRGFQLIREYAPGVEYHAIELRRQQCKGFPHLSADEAAYIDSHTVWGDQGDDNVLAVAVRRFGPFDLIIDDGSHVSKDMITSLTFLFEHGLSPGRAYVLEDTFFAFIRQNGGSREAQQSGDTVVTMLRDLLTMQQHYWWWTKPEHQSPMARRNRWLTEFGLGPRAARGTRGACETGVRKYRILDLVRTIDCDRGICVLTKRHDGPFPHRIDCPGNATSCDAENY